LIPHALQASSARETPALCTYLFESGCHDVTRCVAAAGGGGRGAFCYRSSPSRFALVSGVVFLAIAPDQYTTRISRNRVAGVLRPVVPAQPQREACVQHMSTNAHQRCVRARGRLLTEAPLRDCHSSSMHMVHGLLALRKRTPRPAVAAARGVRDAGAQAQSPRAGVRHSIAVSRQPRDSGVDITYLSPTCFRPWPCLGSRWISTPLDGACCSVWGVQTQALHTPGALALMCGIPCGRRGGA
jgi:hypothetical protein